MMSRPSNTTSPRLGRCRPLMTLNSVVLPAPFGPIRPVMRLASAASATSLTATSPPKRTVTPLTSRSAIRAHDREGEHAVHHDDVLGDERLRHAEPLERAAEPVAGRGR